MASDMAKRKLGVIGEPDDELLQRAVDELTDIMAFAYLMRMRLGKARRTASKDIRLNLSVFSDARVIADRFDLNLGNVRKRFEPLARRGVMRSVRDIRNTMNIALREATKSELPTPLAVDEVIARLRRHGIAPRATSYVETLVRTHAAISYGLAHRMQFVDDVDLWGFEYLTAGDNRVREEHEALDGVKRKKDDEFWDEFWPPNGWNCRCQAVAIYDTDARQTPVPKGVRPDEGFDTDFTELL